MPDIAVKAIALILATWLVGFGCVVTFQTRQTMGSYFFAGVLFTILGLGLFSGVHNHAHGSVIYRHK